MTRDDVVSDDDKTWSDIDNAYVPFVATRFQFASQSSKTQLSTDTEVKGNGDYAFYKVDGSEDEWILAVKNTGSMQHLTFTLNGWIVKKISVSTDFKKVNKKGYASESRERIIDPRLTGFMTGAEVTSYIVTDVDYDDRSLTLKEINKPIPYVAEEGETPATVIGYIIKNATKNEEKSTETEDNFELDVLNNEFHLFVPDMHDTETMNCSSSMMTPQLKETSLTQFAGTGDDKKVNYVLTYRYYQLDNNDNPTGSVQEGEEMFYRVSSAGIKLRDNSAYLQLPYSEVKPKDGHSSPAKFSFVFNGTFEEQPTAIKVPFEEVFGGSDAVYYNLNGQKLNGKPTKGGLYIVNGKKVLVK